MRNLESKFKNRKINYENLLKYGFKKENKKYIYKTKLQDSQFEVRVVISDEISYAKLIDLESETEFILVDIEEATGKFVGKLRQDYAEIIDNIISILSENDLSISESKEILYMVTKRLESQKVTTFL